jgi:hypothetical protein
MIDGIEIIKKNHGFLRESRDSIWTHREQIVQVAEQAKETFANSFQGNVNHRDTIKLFSSVVAIAHVISGFEVGYLCEVASSNQTAQTDEKFQDDITDFCMNAYLSVYSMYTDAVLKRKKVISKNDIELELRRNELDYYPEVEAFIKFAFDWGQTHMVSKGYKTMRAGVLVKEQEPPLVNLISQFVSPGAATMGAVRAQKDLIEEKVGKEKPEIYNILIGVIVALREKAGTKEYPDAFFEAMRRIKRDVVAKEKGLIVIDKEPRQEEFFVTEPEEEAQWEA